MTKQKVFLTGPTEGLTQNGKEHFDIVSDMLEKNYIVTTPHTLYEGVNTTGWTREDYTNIRVAAIRESDCVVLLEGWDTDPYSFRDEQAAGHYKIKIVLAKNILPEYAEQLPKQ